MDVIELAPCMSPASGLDDPAPFVEMMKSSIGIGLQNTGKRVQMLPGMFSLAIHCVGEPHSWRHMTARWSIVAHIGPEPRCLGLACARGQHRNRRVIAVYFRSREHVLA